MKAMRNILLVMMLMISIMGFSQKNEKSFFLHGKTTDIPHSKRTAVGWSDTKRVPEKGIMKLKDAQKTSVLNLFNRRMPPTIAKTVAAPPKTHKSTKQQLDSVFWYYRAKTVYTYDDAGNNVSATDYYLNNSTWVEESKSEFKYDAQGNLTEAISTDKTYMAKSVLEYDTDGNLSRITEYYWDDSDWIEDYKEEYEYNPDGSAARIISYYWDDDQDDWIMDYKEDCEYNPDGSIASIISYYWDDDQDDWIMEVKFECAYNPDGNIARITYCYWDDYIDDWTEMYKYEYEYDANAYRKFKRTFFYWDWYENDWVEEEEYMEYEYDAAGNLLSEASYTWDEYDGEWYGSKYVYNYDMSYSKADLYFPIRFDDMYNKRLNGIFYWRDGTDWIEEESESEIYYWSEHTVGIGNHELQITNYEVYPNPTSGQLRISISDNSISDIRQSKIEIYDVVGKLQNAEHRTQNEEIVIDISHLTNGMYFLKIDNKVVKVIKQ